MQVRDMDDHYHDKSVGNLPLCKYCAEILGSKQNDIYKDNNDFVKELQKAIPQETATDVDILGYTKEWQEISLDIIKRKITLANGVELRLPMSLIMDIYIVTIGMATKSTIGKTI